MNHSYCPPRGIRSVVWAGATAHGLLELWMIRKTCATAPATCAPPACLPCREPYAARALRARCCTFSASQRAIRSTFQLFRRRRARAACAAASAAPAAHLRLHCAFCHTARAPPAPCLPALTCAPAAHSGGGVRGCTCTCLPPRHTARASPAACACLRDGVGWDLVLSDCSLRAAAPTPSSSPAPTRRLNTTAACHPFALPPRARTAAVCCTCSAAPRA